MSTLNERIKELRKSEKKSQKEFAKIIGISQRSVSWGEQPGNNVPDSTIKTICMAFNVNENWLRNGIEPMYIESSKISLDEFVKEQGGTELEIEVMKAYFELDSDIRKMLVQHFKDRLTATRNKPASPTAEDAEAVYIKSRSMNAQKLEQFALNTTAKMESISTDNNKPAASQ